MKKLYSLIIMPVILCMLFGCGNNNQTKNIKIAVMGNPEDFNAGYKEGIEMAAENLNSEYFGSGYTVECEFYNDNGNYDEGAAIIDTLAADESVTAVLGSIDMDINKTAAHIFNEAGKLFVVPHFLYDSVYEDNHYDKVFSMCNSADTVGKILRNAASSTGAKRWAICMADGEFEQKEMNGFLQSDREDGIEIVDCANISMLVNRFDEIYDMWEILSVEGVVMFPYGNEGFDILKKIKNRNPNIVCAGDTAFDRSEIFKVDEEIKKAMNGFIMAEEFMLYDKSKEETDIHNNLSEKYYQKTGKYLDTWFFQAYNSVRMIADTAIQNHTVNSNDIAKLLKENGYKGLCQKVRFDENGSLITDEARYLVFDNNGNCEVRWITN